MTCRCVRCAQPIYDYSNSTTGTDSSFRDLGIHSPSFPTNASTTSMYHYHTITTFLRAALIRVLAHSRSTHPAPKYPPTHLIMKFSIPWTTSRYRPLKFMEYFMTSWHSRWCAEYSWGFSWVLPCDILSMIHDTWYGPTLETPVVWNHPWGLPWGVS